MKKVLSPLLVAIMLLMMVAAAAEDSVSAFYQNGTLTINASVSQRCTVSIDNNVTNRWVGGELSTVTIYETYTEGTHTVHLYNSLGEMVASCSFKVTDHMPMRIVGRAASCTTEGLTDGMVCQICGKTITEQTVIQATGHALTHWTPADENKHVRTCTRCEADVETASCTDADLCVVCGRVGDALNAAQCFALAEAIKDETMTVISEVSADALPDQIVARRQDVNDNLSVMTVAIVKDGAAIQPTSALTVTMPSAEINGYKLVMVKATVEDDQTVIAEEEISVTVSGNNASFTVDFTGADAAYIRLEK